jgi:hypothetical protein
MAMYVTTHNYKLGTNQHMWYVGGNTDILRQLADNVHQPVSVQADGHELDAIKIQFGNLPYCTNARVVRFYDDHARFILGNIK